MGLKLPGLEISLDKLQQGKKRFQAGMLGHFKRKILVENKPHWHLLPMGLVWKNKGKVQST